MQMMALYLYTLLVIKILRKQACYNHVLCLKNKILNLIFTGILKE